MSFPYMTVSQVAEELGVSESRIRQLVAGDAIPRPLRLGQRMMLWSRANIRAFIDQTSNSGSAASLGRATQPLRKTADLVLHGRQRAWSQAYPFHVRVYEGTDRAVVLLSEPIGTGNGRMLTNWIEGVIEDVSTRVLPDRDIGSVTWVDLWPPSWDSGRARGAAQPVAHIRNVILERQKSGVWGSPSWVSMTEQGLDDLLGGAQVDWYDWPHYDERLVSEWTRTGRPVETVDDPAGVQPLVARLEDLLRTSSGEPWCETARTALLHQIRLRLDWPANEPHSPHPAVNTSTQVLYELPTLIVRQAQGLVGPGWDDVEAGYHALIDALDSVDEFSGRTDDEALHLRQLLAGVLEAQEDLLRITDFKRAHALLNQPPTHLPVMVEMTSRGWDRQYLAQARWFPQVDPVHETVQGIPARTARILRHTLGGDSDGYAYPEQQLTFGVDPRGIALLRRVWVASHNERITDLAIMWPTHLQPVTLDGLHVVADGATGDRPVYLAERDQIVSLLPRSRAHAGWNFGYGGGGPGQLETDIANLLTDTLGFLGDDTRRRLTASVESDPHQLDIPLSRFKS